MTGNRDGGDSPYHIDGIDYSNNESAYIAYKIGIYGWRKRCLYFMILLVLIMAVINLALIIWIIRTQDFGLHGMGKLYITSNGIRVEGVAEFMAALKLKTVISGAPLQFNSRRNISLSAFDENNNIMGQVILSSKQIILKNKELFIRDHRGKIVLYANDSKIQINMPNMGINVRGGLVISDHLQCSAIHGDDRDLHLESRMMKVNVMSTAALHLNSHSSEIRFESLKDTKMLSKRGKVIFDARKIQFKNIKMSTLRGDPIKRTSVGDPYGGVAEVCMCDDGTLFLAPPDPNLQCKITADVCS